MKYSWVLFQPIETNFWALLLHHIHSPATSVEDFLLMLVEFMRSPADRLFK